MAFASIWSLNLVAGILVLIQCVFSRVEDFTCPDPEQNRLLHECDVLVENDKITTACAINVEILHQQGNFPRQTLYMLFGMESVPIAKMIFDQSTSTSCLQMLILSGDIFIDEFRYEDDFITRKDIYAILEPRFDKTLETLAIIYTRHYPVAFLQFNSKCANVSAIAIDGKCDVYFPIKSTKRNNSEMFKEYMAFNPELEFFEYSVRFSYLLEIKDFGMFDGRRVGVDTALLVSDNLKKLPTNYLVKLSQANVTDLNIISTALKVIRPGDIPKITSLERLDLSNSDICCILEGAFENITNLKILKLDGNRLTQLPPSLIYLQNLQELSIKNTEHPRREDLNWFLYDKGILENLPNLTSLKLGNTKLLNFWESEESFLSLIELSLSNCSLKQVPDKSISMLAPNLKILDLSNNLLRNIPGSFVSGITTLEVINLSGNLLAHVTYDLLVTKIPSLKEIILSKNMIRALIALTFTNASNLHTLDLSSNQIVPWDRPIFYSKMKNLTLILSHNNITEVNSQMIRDFNQLRNVRLMENPFDCNFCTLKAFLTWLNLHNTSTDFLESPYKCYYPNNTTPNLITQIPFENCTFVVFDWITVVLVPSIVSAVILALIAWLLYVYRWHLRYCNYLFRFKIQPHRRPFDGNEAIFKYDAFVSYCNSDVDWVANYLVPVFENQEPKLHVCVHDRNFEIGDTIMNNVIECIDNSHKSVFIISQNFINSLWCQWELQMAKHKLFDDNRDVLLLVMLEDIDLTNSPKLLQYLIRSQTYLQWPKNEDGQMLFWKRLKDSIGRCRCVNGAPEGATSD